MPHFSITAKAIISCKLNGIAADDEVEAVERGKEMIEDVIKYGTCELNKVHVEVEVVKEDD